MATQVVRLADTATGIVAAGSVVTSDSVSIAGDDRYLLVAFGINNDDYQTGQSVVLDTGGGGTPLTFLGSAVNDDDALLELWGLPAPPTGTFTVTGTATGPLVLVDQHMTLGVWALSDVSQSGPTIGSLISDLDVAVGTSTVATQVDDLVLGAMFQERVVRWGGTINVDAPANRDFFRGGTNGDGLAGASLIATGETTSITFRSTVSTSTNIAGLTAAFGGIDAPPPEPSLTYSWSGIPDEDGGIYRASCKVANAADVRLVVATDAALTAGRVTSTLVAPDSAGWVKASVSGLSAGTYHYGWELTDASDDVTSTGSQGILSLGASVETIVFGSCLDTNSTADSLTRALAHDPSLFFFLGDFHYRDSSSTSAAVHRGYIESQVEVNFGLREMLAKVPNLYVLSDHDAGAPGLPGAWTAPNRDAYKQVVPHLPLTDSDVLYYSFTRLDGKVRFIVTDQRYARTSSSMLGTTQHAWFKQQLAMPEPVKVWVQDSAWITDQVMGLDRWADYAADRDDIAAFIAANECGQIVTIHGDQHAIAADDGTNNDWGGFPSWCAAPFDRPSSHKAPAWSEGIWPTTTGVSVQQYGRMVIDASDPAEVSLSFAAFDSTDTQRITHSVTVPLSSPTSSQWSVIEDGIRKPLLVRGVIENGSLVAATARLSSGDGQAASQLYDQAVYDISTYG